MYIYKKAYKLLCARLQALAPNIKHIDIWNEQPDNNITFAVPAVFIEFPDFNFYNLSAKGKVQSASGNIAARIVTEKYSDSAEREGVPSTTQADALERFNMVQQVHNALQGYSVKDCFRPLERGLVLPDYNHEEHIIDIVNYGTVLIDMPDDESGVADAANKYSEEAEITDIAIVRDDMPEPEIPAGGMYNIS